jgi:hypothetical protein
MINNAISELTTEEQNKWYELQRGSTDPLDTLGKWTPAHRHAITCAWNNWTRTQTDAGVVLHFITKWSHKLGVQLACTVAREALRYVPEGEMRPIRAIETAERWVRGQATKQECRHAADDAGQAANTCIYTDNNDPFNASYAAAYAAYAAATEETIFAAYNTEETASYAAAAYVNSIMRADEDSNEWQCAQATELHRLCVVIADDMLKGHAADWMR